METVQTVSGFVPQPNQASSLRLVQPKLPKHYVAWQKLCLRATGDYWVNAMNGQPFFLVNKELDPGLLKVLEEEIVPRFEGMVTNQPSQDGKHQRRFFTVLQGRHTKEFSKKQVEHFTSCKGCHA